MNSKSQLQLEEIEIDPTLIAKKVCHHFNSLPKTGKLSDNEWTTLAAIVKSSKSMNRTKNSGTEDEPDAELQLTRDYEVVSCATGTKCLGQKELSKSGDVVSDSHAEVLARRCFQLYLYNQMENSQVGRRSIFNRVKFEDSDSAKTQGFALRCGIRFHLFVSHLPCGDAAIIQKLPFGSGSEMSKTEDQEDDQEPQAKKSKLEDSQSQNSRTGAKLEAGPLIFEQIQSIGKCRVKPGKGDPTLCMSCSDKIAKWQLLGLQGSLLGNFIPTPVRLSSIIIGSDVPFNKCSLERAVFARFQSKLENLKSPAMRKLLENYSKPEFYNASVNFMKMKNEIVDAGTNSAVRRSPSPSSIIWHLSDRFASLQVIVNGRKQGATKKQFGKPSTMVDICRSNMFKTFLDAASKSKIGVFEDEINPKLTYLEAKELNRSYFECCRILKGEIMEGWTKKPDGLQDFRAD